MSLQLESQYENRSRRPKSFDWLSQALSVCNVSRPVLQAGTEAVTAGIAMVKVTDEAAAMNRPS